MSASCVDYSLHFETHFETKWVVRPATLRDEEELNKTLWQLFEEIPNAHYD
eukprot:CAMPEP_0116542532 /NCGR_PEP_ID=MMETSP0397-20121206/1067_1 /TAXON_ID=216820 /ORGANISM="Cyclophora tenuis, Strain ECT3854" /LENGTH=50 /DNA_ID=CAMNT_0004066549 /DNA_START=286 /DNA_END=438 /DNA_ORIENTATION=-